MRSMTVPGSQDPSCPRLVPSGPDQRVPVGVEENEPATRPKHPSQLPEDTINVVDVLDHLRRDDGVEASIGKGELGCIADNDIDPVAHPGLVRTPRCDGVHVCTNVEGRNLPGRSDLDCQLAGEDARSRSEIEDHLARLCGKSTTNRISLNLYIRGRIRPLELSRCLAVVPKPRHQSIFPHSPGRLNNARPASGPGLLRERSSRLS